MAKTAKFAATCWELTCPSCNEPLPSPGNGSHIWTAEDLRSRRLIRTQNLDTGKTTAGTSCACGQWVRMPASLLAKAAA